MRERSTWNREQIKKAAQKRADIYTMNQEHPQPAFDEYVIGDPSDFAEDVHTPNTWESEYSGDEVKRNEIGMPEMRGDTFNHSEKTAKEVLVKKANLCVAVATMMLSGKKTASETAIEDQAVALMFLPDAALLDTHARLAAQQDDGDDDDQDKGQDQDKQAGEIPEAFKENIEKMKAKSEDGDKKEDDGEKKEAAKAAGEMPDFIKEKIEDKKEESKDEEKKEASEEPKDVPNEGGDQNAKANANKQATEQMAQMQQMMAQLQQMLQQAQAQQAPQQAPMAAADELDVMLADRSCGPMAEADIQMDVSPMDDGLVMASEEDEVLRSLFANEESESQEEIEQAQKQASGKPVRTASTRTVGTVPSQGVAKLGGTPKTASADNVDALSGLWKTAPDVRETFGLK